MAQDRHVTRHIAEFAVGLEFEHLSADAVTAAKRFLLDSVACAFGGYRTEDSQILRELHAELGGSEESTVLVSGEQTSALAATLLNSHLIRALDYNDIYWKQDPSHPSDIIPAALSLAEREGRSGRDLIVGIVLAYEFEMRLCEAAFPGIREYGWHHATLTGLASPIAAGKMLDLNVDQMVNAIGISGSRSCTLGAVTAGKLTMMKNTVDPLAAQNGVLAALLAERGFTGPEHVIDGKEGLTHVFGHEWKLNILTDGLGESFRIAQCGMKGFPTEALTHAPLTAVLRIVKTQQVGPDDVESIEVKTIRRAADILSDPSKYNPDSKETADHSLPWCIAAAVARGRVTPAEFSDEALKDAAIRGVINKVKVVAEPAFEEMFPRLQVCEVTFHLKNGERLTERVDYAKGDPRDPLTDEEIAQKLAALSEGLLSPRRRGEILATIEELESSDNVIELVELLIADQGIKK
jgi:2-methylcitrate dehydratase